MCAQEPPWLGWCSVVILQLLQHLGTPPVSRQGLMGLNPTGLGGGDLRTGRVKLALLPGS